MALLRDGQEIPLDKRRDPQETQNPEAELCTALSGLQTDQSLQAKGFSMLECPEIALLNNLDFHKCFSAALDKLISQLKLKFPNQEGSGGSGSGPDELLYVLDVSEGFSLLPLIAARLGPVKAYSSVEKSKHQEVLKRLARSNRVPEQHLEFWLNQVEDEQGVLQRPSTEKLWSAIILDCVETCGLIRQKLMEKASLAR